MLHKILHIFMLAGNSFLSRFLACALLALSGSIFQLLFIYYSAQFAKNIVSASEDSYGAIILSIISVSISGLASSAFSWLTIFNGKEACRAISTDISKSFYSLYINSSPFKINRLQPTEEIATLTVQLNQFSVGVINQSIPLLVSVLNAFFIVIAIIIELKVLGACLILVLGSFAILYTAKNKTKVRQISKDFRKLSTLELRSVTDAILSLPQLEISRLRSKLIEEYSGIVYRLRGAQTEARYITSASKPLLEMIVYISLFLYALFLFSFEKSQTSMSQLMVFLVVLVSAIQRAIPSLNAFSTAVNSVRASGDSIQKLYSISMYFNKNATRLQASPAEKNIIADTQSTNSPFRVTDLIFNLGSNLVICNDIEFDSNSKIMALIGHSGIGKSSLIKALIGLSEISSGDLILDAKLDRSTLKDQQDSEDPTLLGLKCFDHRFRQVSAVAMQDTYLYEEKTVLFNIAFESNHSLVNKKLLSDALYYSCLDHSDANNISDNFMDITVKSSGTVLSGGQRKRIGIARAVYANKPVIILDEPTAGLNHELEARLLFRLHELSRARHLIISSHSKALINLADTIYIISHTNNPSGIFVSRLKGDHLSNDFQNSL